MAGEPAAKRQNTGSGRDADSLDNQVIFCCYYCKREIPHSSLHVLHSGVREKLRHKTFHINCIRDYFANFESVNEERRNEIEADGEKATTENKSTDSIDQHRDC